MMASTKSSNEILDYDGGCFVFNYTIKNFKFCHFKG